MLRGPRIYDGTTLGDRFNAMRRRRGIATSCACRVSRPNARRRCNAYFAFCMMREAARNWDQNSMSLYTPLAYLLASALLLAFAATPLLRPADSSWHGQSARTSTIDGLRGFLALGVFFHHALIYHRFLQDGVWTVPPATLYAQLGGGAVILFFMVTGFLFWGKAVDCEGRLPWIKLYVGRIFRIGPLYYVAILAMIVLVFAKQGFTLLEPLNEVGKELFHLAVFRPVLTLDAYKKPTLILAGVTWTLQFEWLFYVAVLPISAIFARRRRTQWLYAIGGLLLSFGYVIARPGIPASSMVAFFSGMLCATIRSRGYCIAASGTSDRLASLLVVVLLVGLAQLPASYAALPLFILFLTFALISSGATIFGLLELRSSRRLGEISYGIYLLQGLVLYFFSRSLGLRSLAFHSSASYWVVMAALAAILVLVALGAHLLVEKPGIALGRRFSALLEKGAFSRLMP